jgi:hypothetical protein
MKFQVTEVEFDFEMEDGEYASQDYQYQVIDETFNAEWEVENEEDLVEEITNQTGWCIKAINYQLLK